VLIGIGIIASQNRSVWIGSAVSLVALGVLYRRFGRPSTRRVRKDQAIVYALVLVLGAGLFLGMSRMGVTLSRRANTLPNLSETESFRWRRGMWDKAIRMTKARPLMGWGIGTFPINQALFFHPACRVRDQRTILLKGASLYENAHNTYLQMSAEIGVVGLLLYLAVLGSFIVAGVRLLPEIQSRYRARILCGSMAAVIGQVVSGIGNPAWEFAQCSLFLWVAIGVGALAAGLGDRGRTSERASDQAAV
jgi:O-antigen ligase